MSQGIRIRVPFPQGNSSKHQIGSRPDGETPEAHLLCSDRLTKVKIISENSNTSFITTLLLHQTKVDKRATWIRPPYIGLTERISTIIRI
jgi:hypothetical protein